MQFDFDSFVRTISESARSVIYEHENQAVINAVRNQEDNDIITFAFAMLKEKVPDEKVIQALVKYYGLDYNNAKQIVQREKNISIPSENLKDYLVMDKGYSDSEAYSYLSKNGVRQQLKANTRLRQLKPAQLFTELEKENNK